ARSGSARPRREAISSALLYPRAPAPRACDPKRAPPLSCRRPVGAMKILHADDHSLFREGLRFFVKLLDPQVVVLEASNIQAALDKLALEAPVDLIVLDLQMPGMSELDGFFAIHRRYPNLPIVVVSGLNDPRTIRALIDGGARGYIPKLASSEQLMA